MFQRRAFLALAVGLFFSVSIVKAFSPFAGNAPSIFSKAQGTTLSERQLIDLAKDYVANRNGFYNPIDASVHADDFVFRAGIIGPLNKVDYIDTMTKLGIYKTFDLQPNAFGFCVDPEDTMMVRFFVRYTGQQVQPWSVTNTPVNVPLLPNNKPIQGPTEAFCIRFNEQGQVKFLSISNPILFGNPRPTTTGKLGAVLGLFEHLGQPLIAQSAMNDNLRKTNNWIAQLLGQDKGAPITQSKPQDLPAWWQGY